MRQNNLILGNSVENLKGAELEKAMAHFAPAIFTETPADTVSDKYTFLSTIEMVRNMQDAGWQPTHVSNRGKGVHGQHMVRFFHEDLHNKVQGSDVMRPQVMFMNSHDGTLRAQVHMGLFRLVCTNGLVVGENGAHDSIVFKHIHADPQAIFDMTNLLTEKYNRVFPTIQDMQERVLSLEEQRVLAYLALTLREPKYLKEDKVTPDFDLINKAHNVDSILRPVRQEDTNPTLWNTFNNLQEKLIKGNFYKYRMGGERNRQPRAITDAKRNLEFNSKLWTVSNALLHNDNFEYQEAEIIL